ncbi:MAG: hypothetical protein HOM16_10355 [Woeseia sp.]|jgi:beta-lactamase superfamily II metal-dependent hydrolase|nr:hypothetical protein [Woeseia sp.]
MTDVAYIKVVDGYLAKKAGDSPNKDSNQPRLLGARLHVELANSVDGWVPARTVPDINGHVKTGFVQVDHLSDKQQLKVFYTDVGQGDATLIEAEGGIVIIDGGPNRGFHEILVDRLEALRRADQDAGLPPRSSLFINAIIVSHFDKDHYYGLTGIFSDPQFEIGKLYHNGLPRYGFNTGKDLGLGDVVEHADGTESISTDLSDIDSARVLVARNLLKTKKGGDNLFSDFLQAVIGAHDANRLNSMRRLYRRDTSVAVEIIKNVGSDLEFEILGPVTTKTSGTIMLPAFPDPHNVTATNPHPAVSESHTINGNSVVLRLNYKGRRFLFGGDLNQPSQKYLRSKYGNKNPFRAQVNKACHHGSSDFDLPSLKKIKPEATVSSSGDNGSYDHPLSDAMGAAARHGVGDFPLVFSTELARDNKTSGDIKLGHINARSNGSDIVMAQKKEKKNVKSPWHKYPIPYAGPFGDH